MPSPMTARVAGPFDTETAARKYLYSLDVHAQSRYYVSEDWPGNWYIHESF